VGLWAVRRQGCASLLGSIIAALRSWPETLRRSLVILLTAACSRAPATSTSDAAPVPAAAAAASADAGAVAPTALTGAPWQMEILDPPLDPFSAASEDAGAKGARVGVVSVPLGAREPRPIMIVLHGAGDRPEWECGSWRGVASAYPFVVCPRGAGADSFLAWSSVADTKARIARAIALTKAMFGRWVRDTEAVVLVGFSMGGIQAALLAAAEPARYPRVALVESSFRPESSMAFGRPWARGGGERVVLVCTTPGCARPYRAAARNVAAHEGAARVNLVGTSSHGIFDEVVRSVRRDWPWLVDGAEGWESYRAPPEKTTSPGRTERFGDD
jgi:pimeloyl-ACP methyl ester carboxylesterase